MARQGHAFATAEDVRVVYAMASDDAPLKDVPRDGTTLGEVVTKGNIVMKEVHSNSILLVHTWLTNSSISVTQRRLGKRLLAAVSTVET